ncbi:hypothetical protein NGR_b15800 (plasmid) [Sinorhizobium fredii NGR234]|uniref:Uncharacterized protein n=1 Tax=Sinorhizobium fredii (strain NBRC 101917 / NGR234) TaxID=394 RepID=C3KKU5_SINFN|nr:hypothetical protein NGR_b15800 [Sinorhizobium fredii NGR234]
MPPYSLDRRFPKQGVFNSFTNCTRMQSGRFRFEYLEASKNGEERSLLQWTERLQWRAIEPIPTTASDDRTGSQQVIRAGYQASDFHH